MKITEEDAMNAIMSIDTKLRELGNLPEPLASKEATPFVVTRNKFVAFLERVEKDKKANDETKKPEADKKNT